MYTRLIPFLLAGHLILAASVNYSYDAAGRLTRIDYGATGSINYTYDKAGNLLSRSVLTASGPALTIIGSHTGNFTQGQSGAVYTLTVTNSGSAATSGIITATETAPAGLTLASMSGTGWTCLANACTRSDALAAASSYPAIAVTVNVASTAPSQVINQASASGGGSATASANDPTTITAAGGPDPVTVFSPGQGATSVSLASALTWTAAAGATSYDLYLGTSSSPPLVANTANTSYCASLNPNATYYWYLVSKNATGSTASAIWSFTTGAAPVHPAFFAGEVNLGCGAYYLQFPNGNLFGYYNYQFFPFLYHYDLGFEYFLDAKDGKGGVDLYDFASGHWLYTSPTYAFPNLVDLNLIDPGTKLPGVNIYYFPDTKNPGRYTSNPRYFVNYVTGMIFTM